MPVISLTEYETKCYGVKIENKDLVKVQKFKNIFDNENNIFCVKPLKTFLGKCDVCNMLTRAGVLDKLVVNGNNSSLKISEENNKHKHVYVRGDKIFSFITNDQFLNYISNMGNNLVPYNIAVGEEIVYFFSTHCKNTKRINFRYVDFLKTNENSVDLFDYHVEKLRPDSFKDLIEFTCIHQC